MDGIWHDAGSSNHQRETQKNARNGVSIVVDWDLKEKIVGVKKLADRLITIKLVLEEDIIHIISAYAPQAESDESGYKTIWWKGFNTTNSN